MIGSRTESKLGMRNAIAAPLMILVPALAGMVLAAAVALAWPYLPRAPDAVWPEYLWPVGGLLVSMGAAGFAWTRKSQLRRWRWLLMPTVVLSALFGSFVLGFGANCYVRTNIQGYEFCK
jgi:hypothetical protein